MNRTEAELLLGLKNEQKKASAFSEIVRLYQERLYWHIRKMVLSHDDANDVLQNTFIKAWNGLDGFRGDSQISTWFYKIATNTISIIINALCIIIFTVLILLFFLRSLLTIILPS
jgi:RNA polymerase sigma-70 factor (ECF subfamily)